MHANRQKHASLLAECIRVHQHPAQTWNVLLKYTKNVLKKLLKLCGRRLCKDATKLLCKRGVYTIAL